MDATKVLARAEQKANSKKVPMTKPGLGLADFAKKLANEVKEDHVMAFAASLTFRGLLAIFPFSILLLSLLGVFNAEKLLVDMVTAASAAIPAEASELLRQQIDQLTNPSSKGAFALSAIIGALLALWGVSGAFRAIMESMNVMYEVDETRGFVRKYLQSILLSLTVVGLFLVALVLLVAGPAIAEWIASTTGLGNVFEWAWKIAQWPILVGLVMLGIALVYYMAPSAEQSFRFVSPGSIIATVMWLVFSLLFSVYVNNFGSYNATYGTLAGVIVLMFYMYYSAVFLLLGAEINQIIEEHHPAGKDEGEKTMNGGGSAGPGNGGGSDADERGWAATPRLTS